MSTVSCEFRVKTLAARLSAALVLAGMGAQAYAAVLPVTSCADDNSVGTLRQVAASALSGDQIDLTTLSCTGNTIALTQGEVVVPHNASIVGSALNLLTVTGSGSGRVLDSTSTDAPAASLSLTNVNVSNGNVLTTATDAVGGCIMASGTLTLTNSTVSGCTASSSGASARGGAVYAQTVSLNSSKVQSSNAYTDGYYALARGGAVYAGTLSCTDSTLTDNSASASGMWWFVQGGGAFVVGGDVDFLRCTVDSNLAGDGGGVMQMSFIGGSAHSIVLNSTISGNSSTGGSGGFNLVCPDCTPQNLQILNSTVAFNTSGVGHGALETAGTVAAQSSIMAKNSNGGGNNADISTNLLSGASNLVMSTNATYGRNVVTYTSDPLLQPLASNGGKTRTHALPATSPAYNHGNNVLGNITDQRGSGYVRTLNGLTDIGAWQHQSSTGRN